MAEKVNYSQFELFSQGSEGPNLKHPSLWSNSFFTRIRGYEKALLIIMSIALTGIISYSLGVEKGRSVQVALPQETVLLHSNESPRVSQNSYTIQIGTFKNKDLALKEFQRLKNMGFTPQAFLKNGHIILCVGKFFTLENAQLSAAQLQKTYAGCRIRRL